SSASGTPTAAFASVPAGTASRAAGNRVIASHERQERAAGCACGNSRTLATAQLNGTVLRPFGRVVVVRPVGNGRRPRRPVRRVLVRVPGGLAGPASRRSGIRPAEAQAAAFTRYLRSVLPTGSDGSVRAHPDRTGRQAGCALGTCWHQAHAVRG